MTTNAMVVIPPKMLAVVRRAPSGVLDLGVDRRANR
jgi:hypothetical protein